MINWANRWVEYFTFLLIAAGAFMSIFSTSAVIGYTLIFLAGLMGGRLWYAFKDDFKLTWAIILIGFLVGFVLGNRYGDDRVYVFLYIFAIAISYYLHLKQIIISRSY